MEAAQQPTPPPQRWRRIRKPLLTQPQLHQQQQQQMDDDSAIPTPISTGGNRTLSRNSRKRLVLCSTRHTCNLNVDFYGPAREFSSNKMNDDASETALNENEELASEEKAEESTPSDAVLSERRKALFEPLEPNMNGKRPSAESLLPPPDFDAASYPKGWLIGKKRKLVNVDVVESMRRIAVQEMNRKDREIDGLNEQLEEDARVLEHLQIQLLEEKSKRTNVERQNAMLQDQINMLMGMLQDNQNVADDGSDEP